VEFRKSFEDVSQEWEIEVMGKVVFESEKLLTVRFSNYWFTGGAHPNSSVAYLNFDLGQGGKLLTPDELLMDKEKLLALAERKFKEIHDVSGELALEDDERFFLPESGFFLPAAMGFENGEWVMLYNPYEIGPYVMGYTELRFGRDEIKGVVIDPD
jgi:hypothetical protein